LYDKKWNIYNEGEFMRKIVILGFIMLLIVSLVGCSSTDANVGESTGNGSEPVENEVVKDDSLTKIQEAGKIRVGLCAAYPPFESRNEETGEIEGFDIDLAHALSDEIGIPVEINDAEWQALLGGLNKGDFDVLITCMSKKEAAAENVNMSDVYYELKDVIVVKEGNDTIQSVDDLEDKTIGVQLGSGSEQIADRLEGLKEIKRYNYNPEAFIDLKNERIDAIVVGEAYAINHIKASGGFEIVNTPLESAEIVMVMRSGEDALTTALNDALKTVKENGSYDEAIDKWLSVD